MNHGGIKSGPSSQRSRRVAGDCAAAGENYVALRRGTVIVHDSQVAQIEKTGASDWRKPAVKTFKADQKTGSQYRKNEMPTGRRKRNQTTKQKRKLKSVLALLWTQFVFPSLAAEGADTNRDVDYEALKQQVQDLTRKVQALEQQRASDQQTNSGAAQQQIQDLDQKVRILGRQQELDKEEAAAVAKTLPKISAGTSGFSFSSADSNFVFSLKGVLQVDSRTFFHDTDIKSNDGFLLRRARPIFQATVDRDFDFRFTPDFGGSTVQIFDAYGSIVTRRGRNSVRANSKPRRGIGAVAGGREHNVQRTLAGHDPRTEPGCWPAIVG